MGGRRAHQGNTRRKGEERDGGQGEAQKEGMGHVGGGDLDTLRMGTCRVTSASWLKAQHIY